MVRYDSASFSGEPSETEVQQPEAGVSETDNSFLLARGSGSPTVTSVTDRGWVGNPETGRVVWVRYRSLSDGSNDVLVSQGARGTGASLSFPGEVDIGTIRDNLGNSSTSIYALSTFSQSALGTSGASQSAARSAASSPTVTSVTDRGWVGNPETG
ncbi:MAG: hypothetical protein ACRCWO_12115, partial [Bosea sp. (in: a-proteobacteria)]